MANWCRNTVWFEAGEAAFQQVREMFLQMAEREKESQRGQLPPFITVDGGWFFNVCWEAEDVLYYESRWLPNTPVLVKIAERYKVNFILDYEELDNLIFGRATFTDGILTDTRLEELDFDAFDRSTDSYAFEGKTFDCEYEILEILLERKIVGNDKKTD